MIKRNKAIKIIKEFIKEMYVILGKSQNEINTERPDLLNSY